MFELARASPAQTSLNSKRWTLNTEQSLTKLVVPTLPRSYPTTHTYTHTPATLWRCYSTTITTFNVIIIIIILIFHRTSARAHVSPTISELPDPIPRPTRTHVFLSTVDGEPLQFRTCNIGISHIALYVYVFQHPPYTVILLIISSI